MGICALETIRIRKSGLISLNKQSRPSSIDVLNISFIKAKVEDRNESSILIIDRHKLESGI